jgi:hypothetical protein
MPDLTDDEHEFLLRRRSERDLEDLAGSELSDEQVEPAMRLRCELFAFRLLSAAYPGSSRERLEFAATALADSSDEAARDGKVHWHLVEENAKLLRDTFGSPAGVSRSPAPANY